jgi:hypothetical protein
MILNREHFLIRVGDGINFKNSNYNIWGMKKKYNRMKEGDVLWFLTSSKFGGKIIGMAEYYNCYDRTKETLVQINTKSNEEMGWDDKDEKWDFQIEYKNLYNTEKQNITGIIKGSCTIFRYEIHKNEFNYDLYQEYENFKRYAEPIR